MAARTIFCTFAAKHRFFDVGSTYLFVREDFIAIKIPYRAVMHAQIVRTRTNRFRTARANAGKTPGGARLFALRSDTDMHYNPCVNMTVFAAGSYMAFARQQTDGTYICVGVTAHRRGNTHET